MLSTSDLPEGHSLRDKPYHVTLMGLILTVWDDSESAIFWLMIWLFGDHVHAQAAHYSIRDNLARNKLCASLIEWKGVGELDMEKKAEVLKLLKEWQGLEERNIIVHGQWFTDIDTGELRRQATVRTALDMAKPGYTKAKVYLVSELEDFFTRVRDFNVRMNGFTAPLINAQIKRRVEESFAIARAAGAEIVQLRPTS